MRRCRKQRRSYDRSRRTVVSEFQTSKRQTGFVFVSATAFQVRLPLNSYSPLVTKTGCDR